MDEILKGELIEIYWNEIVPKYMILTGDIHCESYNNLLPYLKKELLNIGLNYCERKFTSYDPIVNPNPIPFFKKLLTNLVLSEKLGFINNLRYSKDPIFYIKPHESSIKYHNTLYKKLNREYLIDQLVN